MSKHSVHSGDGSDSELDSVSSHRANKLGAILCPSICALFLVCIFAVSFIGTKMAYEQYDNICRGRQHVYRLQRYFAVVQPFKPNASEPNVSGPNDSQLNDSLPKPVDIALFGRPV